jgi:hypothetical protein
MDFSEEDLIKTIKECALDSPVGREASTQLQLLVSRRQLETARELNSVTNGLRCATIWLAIATAVIAVGTIAQVVVLVLKSN